MTYQVLARKWRPQTFEAVVGQDAITRTLRNALMGGRIAHAYLFAGPRGVGKTTTARLLARALLCPDRQGAEPCDRCVVCADTRAGTAVDILEIDGASNRGIDEIRTLRENVKYAPARGRYKVYIIDEVHQLTEAAFNALLKTLEEPPAHIVFILATTDPRDIPATVLSRVQRFDFRPIAPDTLVQRLETILGEEGVAYEAGALPQVVRAAEGSLRDALSLLDTVIAYGDGKVAADTVAHLLGATAPVEVRAFVTALLAHDVAGALGAIDRAAREGEDLGAFARDVIEMLRRTLVLRAAPRTSLADLTPTEADELRALGETVGVDELLYVIRAFLEADALMRESPHPRIELEIATVRATRRPVPHALEDVLRRVDEAESRLRQAPVGAGMVAQETLLVEPPARTGEPRRPAPRAEPSRAPGTADRPASPPRPVPPPRISAPDPAPAPPAGGTKSAAANADRERTTERDRVPDPPATTDLDTAWQRVVDEVMRKKPMLGAVLMHARAVSIGGGELTVVLTGNHFHRETLAEPANRELVRAAVTRNIAGADRFAVVTETNGGGAVTDDPTVQAALAEFDGEIVAVRRRAPEGEGQ